MRRVTFFSAGLFTIAALCLTAAVAMVWREMTERDPDERIAITAEFVSHCQTEKPECVDMVTGAMRWAVRKEGLSRNCLAKRPSARTMARATVIWLNAHIETHPLPMEQGIAKAADAIWPCPKKSAAR